jgi:hypothetical protein
MTTYDWQPFLEEWSWVFLNSPDLEDYDLPPEVIESGWLGFPGATEEQIAAAEARLGTTFPPSYREFLKVSNGWRHVCYSIDKVWSVEDVEWFRTRHQGWIDGWTKGAAVFGVDPPVVSDEDYSVYGPEQDCIHLRPEYLSTALEISEMGDIAILLLNPQITTPKGEWEAWFFADWNPGADRYRSFWDLMQDFYAILRERVEQKVKEHEETEAKRLQPTDTPEMVRTKLSGLITEIEKEVKAYEQRGGQIALVAAKAAQEVVAAMRHAKNETDDLAQLFDRLAAIAEEFEQKAVNLTSQINARIRQAEVIRKEAANDDAWREWALQSQKAGHPVPLLPELLKSAFNSVKGQIKMRPLLKPNESARAEVEAYEDCTAAIRSFLEKRPSKPN